MLQLIGLIVALVGSVQLALSGAVNPLGISGGGPVGSPHPHATPAIVLPATGEDFTAPR
jgi:hypothetical protein